MMEEILNFLPLIAIILFGIIKGTIGNNEQNEKKQRTPSRPTNVPRPNPTPSGGQERTRSTTQRTAPVQPSIEEQQKQQMEQLKSRMNTGSKVNLDDISQQDVGLGSSIQDAIKHQATNKVAENKEKFKKEVKTGLNRRGLVQGIIMSEVLGPPRARKPYQNVITERKRHISR